MLFSRTAAAIVMASLSTPLLAASGQSVGTVVVASQDTIVSRDGRLLTAHAGQPLFVGDRVITRGSSAKVAMPGCNIALAPTSMLSVGGSACAAPTSFAAAQDNSTEGAIAAEGLGGTNYIVAAFAVLALAGGTVAATSNTDTTSVSP